MKTKILARILAAAGLGALLSFFAPLASAQSPNEPAMTGVQKELNDLVQKIQARLGSLDAPPTESVFAEELKQFDAILAARKGDKTDDVAQVLFMKAMLYGEVFNDADKAAETLKQIKVDFPGTKQAGMVDEGLAYLEKQKAAATKKASLAAGATFPDFAVKDTAGNDLSVGKYKGKVVLVDFWATWCPPCVAELPHVQTAYQKYHDKGFEVIGISLDRDAATLAKYVADKGMSWAQHWDDGGTLATSYGIMSIPATFLLDGEGRIVATDLRGPELEEHLAKLLGQ
ncbi:TlpA family protein disulfide reductase [Termitidicoccus mucosus]|uniref:Thioredoxin domain-containing protein n=1 Tax=Termitidicoccus mucosus TaxID=1184151 RepID=A0A178ILZ7_9BACT|nr:hypothetical protein AW736_00290 [Opitutaceae bacterium TSB47]